jgi:hypothetical protein
MPTDTFPIAVDTDDGTGYRGGVANWADIGTGLFVAEETTTLVASKTQFGGDFFVDNAFMRFDTSSLPDIATITSANLLIYAVNIDNGNSVTYAADFYDFGGEPSVAGDWEQTSSGDAISLIEPNNLTEGIVNTVALTGLTGINKTGYTGIRIAPANTTQPTTINAINIASLEDAPQEPRLEVTYTTSSLTGPTRFAGPVKLGTSAATLFTSSGRSLIEEVHVQNPSGSPVDLTVSIGADAAGTRIFDGLSIAADSEKKFRFVLPLENGEIMQAFAGTNNVLDITVDGQRLT